MQDYIELITDFRPEDLPEEKLKFPEIEPDEIFEDDYGERELNFN